MSRFIYGGTPIDKALIQRLGGEEAFAKLSARSQAEYHIAWEQQKAREAASQVELKRLRGELEAKAAFALQHRAESVNVSADGWLEPAKLDAVTRMTLDATERAAGVRKPITPPAPKPDWNRDVHPGLRTAMGARRLEIYANVESYMATKAILARTTNFQERQRLQAEMEKTAPYVADGSR